MIQSEWEIGMTYRNFWENGYRIFGLHGVDDNGNCECGNPECKAVYKHPRITRWSLVPHWSEEQFENMVESGQFDTGYGILCKGLLVIDVDARNGGMESYAELCRDIPEVMEAGLIVETGSGGGSKHLYFKVDDSLSVVSKLDKYKGIDIKTSGYVVGAGSKHKSGNTYKIVHGSVEEIDYAPSKLLEAITRKGYTRTLIGGSVFDYAESDLIEMLGYIEPDCSYPEWIRVGMALHEGTQGGGLDIWNEWSQKGRKYKGIEDLERHWHSFGRSVNPVTIGTLVHYAEEGGYISSVTFDDDVKENKSNGDLPFSIDDIDLLRPPGLVGELTAWINSMSRYPREHLAVAGALTAMSNIAGLRYTDDKDGISLNLMSLCVSASSTGKESILQSVTNIHQAVNIHRAIVGNIKSEQEIVRNLVRNQASFYLIDEIGYLLQKIESARQKGGSAYLDGIISTIMAVFSKADGSFLVSGDLKDSVSAELRKELSQCYSKIKENEDKNGYYARRAEQIENHGLPEIELGLQRPFLSLMGMTTPVSFDNLVTVEQATNGFVGRCAIIREPETNPRRKKGFRQGSRKLPDNLMMSLSQIYNPDSYDVMDSSRIEYHGDKIQIKTTNEAMEALETIADWLEDFAESHKGRTGLESIIRRSYELLAKISTILAVSDGIRTIDHIRWAFAFICKDMETKVRLAQTNIQEGSIEALENRILDSAGEGEPSSVILQRVCRSKKYKKEDVLKQIKKMVDSNMLLEEHGYHKKTKQKFVKYIPA